MLYRINRVLVNAQVEQGLVHAIIYMVAAKRDNEVRQFVLNRDAHGTDEDAVDEEMHRLLGSAETFEDILALDQHVSTEARRQRAAEALASARARLPMDGMFYCLAHYASPEKDGEKAQIWVEMEDGRYYFLQRTRDSAVPMGGRQACQDLGVRALLAEELNQMPDLTAIHRLNAA